MIDAFGFKNETVFILDELGIKAKNRSFLMPWCYDALDLNSQELSLTHFGTQETLP